MNLGVAAGFRGLDLRNMGISNRQLKQATHCLAQQSPRWHSGIALPW